MSDDQTSPDVEAPEVDPDLLAAVASDEPEQSPDAVARAQAAPPGVLGGTGE